jgi:hypothetical protein
VCAYALIVIIYLKLTSGLQEAILTDKALGVQTSDRHAFIDSLHDLSGCGSPFREELQCTLRKVKQSSQRARTCKPRGRDKIAWCQVVIQPLVELALDLSGNGKLLLQSVYDPLLCTLGRTTPRISISLLS